MKKISIYLAIIIAVVSISSCDTNTTTETKNVNDTTAVADKTEKEVLSKEDVTYSGRIAYVRIDSLLINYKFHTKIQDAFLKKTNRLDKELKDKGAKFQKDAYDFQVKQQNGSFLSQESYQSQGQELAKREQDLMTLNDRYSMELAQEKANLDKQIEDSVMNIIELYNKEADFDFILRKDFLLFGRKGFDITDTITALLNERYSKSQEKTATDK